MAETFQDTISYKGPTQGIRDFYFGGGAGVPGMYPLLNQATANYFNTMGTPGANPYTYQGDRISGFTPAQQEGMSMAAGGVGSYLPYYQKAEGMYGQAGDIAQGAYGTAAGMYGKGLEASMPALGQGFGALGSAQQYTQDAAGLYGQGLDASIPLLEQGQAEMFQGLGAGRGLAGEGADLTRGALPQYGGARSGLGRSERSGFGSTGRFDPSGISRFYDPYEEDVVQQTMKDVREGLAQGDMGMRDEAIGSGAFGGARSKLRRSKLAEDTARGAAEAIGGIRSRGYEGARGAAQQAFEAQQGRMAGFGNLQAQLAGMEGGMAGQEAQNALARGQQLGQFGQQQFGMGMQGGQGLAGLGGLGSEMYGQAAAGMKGLGGQMGTLGGAYGSLGGLGADIYGQYGRNLGTMGMNLGTTMGNLAGQYGNMGSTLYGLRGQDANTMMNIGNLQQAQDQKFKDLAYQNFVGQYALPYQTLGQAFNMGNSAAPYMGGVQGTSAYTQETGGSNPWLDAAGVGLQGYGLYQNAQNNP